MFWNLFGIQLLAYTPLVTPMQIGDSRWKFIWLIPITASLSIVYKSIRCATMKRVPIEATQLFFTIIMGIVLAAAALRGALWIAQM